MTTQAPKKTRKPLTGTRIGVVTSDKRDKTATVVVQFLAKLGKYGKYVKHRTVLQVHDPNNDAREGDKVEVAECRPISKTKSFRLVRIVERAPEQVTIRDDAAIEPQADDAQEAGEA